MARRYCRTCGAQTEPCRGLNYDDRPTGADECSECGEPYETRK